MAKEEKLQVVKKYVVNPGMPNEATYDYVSDAIWVESETGEDLEFHIAKWQKRFGVLDARGGIIIPFQYSSAGSFLAFEDGTAYITMCTDGTMDVFSLPSGRFCQQSRGSYSICQNYDGKQLIKRHRYMGSNLTTFYDKHLKPYLSTGYFDTIEYFGQEDAIKYMYSIVQPNISSSPKALLSTNGDVYTLTKDLRILSENRYGNECNNEDGVRVSGWYPYRDPERHCRGGEPSQNAFICSFVDKADLYHHPDFNRLDYLLIIIPTDVSSKNYKIKDVIRYRLKDYAELKDLPTEIAQQIIW